VDKFTQKIKLFTLTAAGCVGFIIVLFVMIAGVNIAQAAWEEPSSEAPAGNVFAPLHVGAEKQAKKGNLLLDPMFNPYVEPPKINYPLEVRGTKDVYINYYENASAGDFIVDTDTLYVDGTNNMIGIGTSSPSEELEIANGTLNVGSAGAGVSGIGIYASTQKQDYYGAYGLTQADNIASVHGVSSGGPGVYGVHTNGGVGIWAESQDASAVVGNSTSTYYNTGPYVAGIYGRAYGLGSWAGYFEQRIFGAQEVVARKFVPNRLQYSQVPYTAGWEVDDIEDSILAGMGKIAFDGTNFWVGSGEGGWDNEPYFYLIDPDTGALADEFRVLDAGGLDAHYASEMVYEDGFMWTANSWRDSRGLSKIDTDTHIAEIYATGEHVGQMDGAADMVYDTITNPSNVYIWVPNYITEGPWPYTYSYSVTRVQPALGRQGSCTNASYNNRTDCELNGFIWQTPYGFCSDPTYNNTVDCENNGATWEINLTFDKVCPTLNITQCDDDIDNDGDGLCDADGCGAMPPDPNCGSEALAQPCSVGDYDTQVSCEGAGGTWNGDERIVYEQLGKPSSMTFDGINVWVAFRGTPDTAPYTDYQAPGIGKFEASDPVNTKEAFCMGINRVPYDITYGDGYLWTGNRRWGYTNTVSRIDPNNIAEPYSGITNYSGLMPSSAGNAQVEFDDITDGGSPSYIWARNYYGLGKLRIDPATKDLTSVHGWTLPNDVRDFAFDRQTKNGPYVWTTHGTTAMLTKNLVDNPYTTVTLIPKGNDSAGIVFDGTYIWSANARGNTIAKYRAVDGDKIGDYLAGWYPRHIIFDGTNIWTSNDNNTEKISKVRAADGQIIGNYNYATVSNWAGSDMMFDGQYIWISDNDNNEIRIIDPADCDAGVCVVDYEVVSPDIIGPFRLAFDGEYVWVTHLDNNISKLSYDGSDITVEQTITIDQIDDTQPFNIQSILYDGTYIWVGTTLIDADGNSIYKIDPDYAPGTDPVLDAIQVYNDPGQCGVADNLITCHIDSDCPLSADCNQDISNVEELIFDGTHVWAKHGGRGSMDEVENRECWDGIDNDGDGDIDWAGDDNCEHLGDMHEASLCDDGIDNDNDGTCDWGGCGAMPSDTECSDNKDDTEGALLFTDGYGLIECRDNLDNDGNGMCDFDGAIGSPGCIGKPDPGCLTNGVPQTDDASEATGVNEWGHVSRIIAATGQVAESIRYDNYVYFASGIAFDGTNIWVSDEMADNILHKFYSGVGQGLDDLNAVVSLQNPVPGKAQAGSFSLSGDIYLGQDLRVVGDLVVSNNTWGKAVDDAKNFGIGCDNGEFIKGIDWNNKLLNCQDL